jgi:hypothetical protein
MHFTSHTPESLLPRSDSKNPATTCKGITMTGRPCRRPLAPTPGSSPSQSPREARGVLNVLRQGPDGSHAAVISYCWQHRDQAERVATSSQTHKELLPLRERTSIDTLVDRVGALNLERPASVIDAAGRRESMTSKRMGAATDLHKDQWQRAQEPLMSIPSTAIGHVTRSKPRRRARQAPRSNVKTSLLCCVADAGDDDDDCPAPRPYPHRIRHTAPNNGVAARQNRISAFFAVQPTRKSSPATAALPPQPAPSTLRRTAVEPFDKRRLIAPDRPSVDTTPGPSGPQTQGLLSLIPSHLSPQTTAVLLNELSKPISSSDAAGYIYMFWLTPESDTSKPDEDAAADLLDLPPNNRPATDRRPSAMLDRYASQKGGSRPQKTILLKIGRAENVHRRLSQWAKQCSYNITLIRYYPYTPTSRASPPRTSDILQRPSPKKVPQVHRVERLVHVELAESRVTEPGPCGSCGREHREWFEVRASAEGLRTVDEIIRRWVTWAERRV